MEARRANTLRRGAGAIHKLDAYSQEVESTTSSFHLSHISETSDYFLEEFTDELAHITFPPGNDDLPFDAESDLLELEYLLNHDPIKDMDSILEDSVMKILLMTILDDTYLRCSNSDEHALLMILETASLEVTNMSNTGIKNLKKTTNKDLSQFLSYWINPASLMTNPLPQRCAQLFEASPIRSDLVLSVQQERFKTSAIISENPCSKSISTTLLMLFKAILINASDLLEPS
ncbi:hypothetical protein Tco_0584004 [Tanacetum coccineum]